MWFFFLFSFFFKFPCHTKKPSSHDAVYSTHIPDLTGRENRSLASQCIKTKKNSVYSDRKKKKKKKKKNNNNNTTQTKKLTTKETTASSAASWVYSGQ